MTAEEHYQEGQRLMRESRYTEAMNAFQRAIDSAPDSPAATAARESRQMLADIMAFYFKDLYNP